MPGMSGPGTRLVTVAEIAEQLGVTHERARQLTHQPGFPPPVKTVGLVRIWLAEDVDRWISEHRPA
jgi:prophage regulatory protein